MSTDPSRVFLVGCARSGTTLLQSLLFAHPDVISFPETFFFVHAMSEQGRRHRLRLTSKHAARATAKLEQVGLLESPRLPLTERGVAKLFVAAMDAAAIRAGKSLWLEKTPSHLARAELIEKHVPGAVFIHIIRSGPPVVASLYDITRKADWGGPRSVDECIERWKCDIDRSLAHVGKPNHAFVSYERLVGQPRETLEKLCGFLGLEPCSDQMLSGYPERSKRVTDGTGWKAHIGEAISDRNGSKLDAFPPEERARIVAACSDQPVDQFPFL